MADASSRLHHQSKKQPISSAKAAQQHAASLSHVLVRLSATQLGDWLPGVHQVDARLSLADLSENIAEVLLALDEVQRQFDLHNEVRILFLRRPQCLFYSTWAEDYRPLLRIVCNTQALQYARSIGLNRHRTRSQLASCNRLEPRQCLSIQSTMYSTRIVYVLCLHTTTGHVLSIATERTWCTVH